MNISGYLKRCYLLKITGKFLLHCRDGLKLETELLDGKTKLILSPYGMLCYKKFKMLTFKFLHKVYYNSLAYFLLVIE
jgi:hypothetical protein